MTDNHHLRSTASPTAPVEPEQEHGPAPAPAPAPDETTSRTRAGALWAGIIVSAVVLIVLLTFIVQNSNPVEIYFLVWAATLPAGVALLAAAVAGILIVAIPGSSRMMQLRRALRRPDRGRPA
ncbi:MAG TPA: lipopolysaccharide assembly protein LapA domain-containing protein [Actinophytocola sp.]|nr:lipopolysaccharide assembly protein LapA domain-containing protein [Actinophytocola sp.]